MLAPGIGNGTRGFAGIPEEYKTMASMAEWVIAHYTLYQKPLLTRGEILLLIQDACRKVQTENRYVEKDRCVDSYVCEKRSVMLRQNTNLKQLKSMLSRTRGHLVAECKASIGKIYNISGLDTSTTQKVVQTVMECLPWDLLLGHVYDSVGSRTTVGWS